MTQLPTPSDPQADPTTAPAETPDASPRAPGPGTDRPEDPDDGAFEDDAPEPSATAELEPDCRATVESLRTRVQALHPEGEDAQRPRFVAGFRQAQIKCNALIGLLLGEGGPPAEEPSLGDRSEPRK